MPSMAAFFGSALAFLIPLTDFDKVDLETLASKNGHAFPDFCSRLWCSVLPRILDDYNTVRVMYTYTGSSSASHPDNASSQ